MTTVGGQIKQIDLIDRNGNSDRRNALSAWQIAKERAALEDVFKGRFNLHSFISESNPRDQVLLILPNDQDIPTGEEWAGAVRPINEQGSQADYRGIVTMDEAQRIDEMLERSLKLE